MKFAGLVVVILSGSLLLYATADFPAWGDPASPAGSHVSPYYIENTIRDTAVPNIVTAVLGDYRGFDTMFETIVIFSAGMACFLLLRATGGRRERETLYRHVLSGVTVRVRGGRKLRIRSDDFEEIDRLWTPQDLIVRTVCRLILPFIQLFGLYVVIHGHHSPGGGFQGGVILGAGFILHAIGYDLRTTLRRMREKTVALVSAAGALIFAGVGTLCIFLGGRFLDYSALARLLFTDQVLARSHGIFLVEVGVGLAVMATMVIIYYNLASAGELEEGL